MDSDGAHFPRAGATTAFLSRGTRIKAGCPFATRYDAIYLYAISFCHFTVGSGGALLVSLAAR